MKRVSILTAMLVVLSTLGAFVANAQDKPRHIISIFNVAPGKHLQFLKWLADQEALDKEVGVPPAQLYVHQDGASWDYMSITEVPDPAKEAEMGKKRDAIAKKKGMATGMAASLEFRQFVSSHTDTYVGGPYTAVDIVKEAEKK